MLLRRVTATASLPQNGLTTFDELAQAPAGSTWHSPLGQAHIAPKADMADVRLPIRLTHSADHGGRAGDKCARDIRDGVGDLDH